MHKDLTDVNSDTLLANIDSINACLQNIHYYKLSSLALKNNTLDIILLAGEITNKLVYFSVPSYSSGSFASGGSFYEGRVLSYTPQKSLNGNGFYAQSNVARGPTWSNNNGTSGNGNAYNKPVKLLPQIATLSILNIDKQNNVLWSQCFNDSMENGFKSIIT